MRTPCRTIGLLMATVFISGTVHARHYEHKEHHLRPTGLFGVTSPSDIKVTKVQPGSPADGKIKVGDETKQIVAGIRQSYDAEALKGKKVVVVNNLESAKIRGEESNGMLLVAIDNGVPVILTPEKDVPSGSKIS